MANNFFGATSLTGGGTGALDAIDGTDLADLDAAFVVTLSYIYFYSLDVDSAAAESSPDVISPDTNAGNKRWILTGINQVTATEIQQLENIGSTTISAAQWGYLGALNQGLTTTSDVQFGSILADKATHSFKVTEVTNLADEASVALEDYIPTSHGILFLIDWSGSVAAAGAVFIRSGANNVVECFDPLTKIDVADTDGQLCVIADGDTTYTLKNRLGHTSTVLLMSFGD